MRYETPGYQRSGDPRLDPAVASLYPSANTIPWPVFLTAADRRRAEQEWQALDAIDAAPNHLGRIIVDWARRHPEDRRAPEALHRVVRATRYGCTTDATGDVSRTAFDLLHRRYPKSEWAARTRYWFK